MQPNRFENNDRNSVLLDIVCPAAICNPNLPVTFRRGRRFLPCHRNKDKARCESSTSLLHSQLFHGHSRSCLRSQLEPKN